MRNGWYSAFKDYLTFTKRERTGIIIALIIGVTLFYLPHFFSTGKQVVNKQAFIHEIAQLKISVDSNKKSFNKYSKDDEPFDYYQPKKYAYENTAKGELFNFDPNTLDANGWRRLGIKDKTAQTIQKLLSKGFKFRQPEDIKKIYGLKPDQADRLIPYIHLTSNTEAEHTFASNKPAYSNPYVSKKSNSAVIDINNADTSALIVLPGIGSKLAARIVGFRNKLGGFSSVAQLGETYGLPDSTFKKIQPQLRCDHPTLKTININTADANQLKAHPYISWSIANAIVNYRQQHGDYKAVGDIMKINIITNEIFTKISPYLATL